jgi:hypothetical protein
MLKAREEEEMRELAQKVETRPKVLSANEMTNEVVLDADSAKGAAAGQLFAISRDQKFVAIVEIRKTADDHSSGGVWRGLAMGRVLPGDRAERVGDVRAFLSALPEEVRRALAARENLETIRTKMRLRE